MSRHVIPVYVSLQQYSPATFYLIFSDERLFNAVINQRLLPLQIALSDSLYRHRLVTNAVVSLLYFSFRSLLVFFVSKYRCCCRRKEENAKLFRDTSKAAL
ncbi:hypothetical protein DM01DRAFT_1333682 [Hesseltinella vesiculosa]|uniref:Uncharacterized protein n=1 Tax=Hesseltinella vesiculosa TaxID=101127 RepID=A0A1X2GPX6_9FUNG|nr:hypothetical protein DM01DRAFT_1333682 [Hesseltinella vesiculosa]